MNRRIVVMIVADSSLMQGAAHLERALRARAMRCIGADGSEETMTSELLEVKEIFRSIQGESTWAGHPCVFVRLSRCNLRCAWCDTPGAFGPGRRVSVDEVLTEVEALGPGIVEVTGGEPLLQPASLTLMSRLLEAGKTVLLETSGSVSIRDVPEAVHRIVDLKAPSSGECEQNLWENLPLLSPRDELKLVLADRADYEWARKQIAERGLERLCYAVILSPVGGSLPPEQLAAWLLEDGLPVRLGLQLHRYLGLP